METMQFEPMSVGRIFDRAFLIYRNNFLRFVTIVAIIEVPLALISTASRSWVGVGTPARQSTAFERPADAPGARSPARAYNPSGRAPVLFGCLGSGLGLLLQMVGGMLCQAALIKSVSEVYLGHEITVGQAYGFILPRSATLILATICTSLIIGLGFVLFIVPGIIFGLWFSLTTATIVVENHSATSGMSRSKALVAGNLDKVFLVGLLAALIAYIVMLPLNYVGLFLARALAANNVALVLFIRHFAVTISQILVTPISAGAFILLYYDLRIRKEGFDLQMLAQSMTSGQGELRAV